MFKYRVHCVEAGSCLAQAYQMIGLSEELE
jgi:hypothetical protein